MRARGTVEKGLVRVSARDRDGNGNGRGLGRRGLRDEGSDERKEEKATKWTKTEGDNALCFDSRSVPAQGCTSHWPAFEFCTPCNPFVHLKHNSERGHRTFKSAAKFYLMSCQTWRIRLYEVTLHFVQFRDRRSGCCNRDTFGNKVLHSYT
jgi:hypothetical protein